MKIKPSLTLIVIISLISIAAVAWGGSEKKARSMYNQALLLLGKYEPLKAEKLLKEIVSEHMDTSVATEAIRTLQTMKYSRTIEKYGNVRAKTALGNLITAMDGHYKDRKKYATSINELEEHGFYISDKDTTVTIVYADGKNYIAKAFHGRGDKIYLVKRQEEEQEEEEIEDLQPTSLKVALLGTIPRTTSPSVVIREVDKRNILNSEEEALTAIESIFRSEKSEEEALAIIKDKGKKRQDLYREGDTIQGAVIKRILRGKVILRVGGKDEILTIEESAASRTVNRSEMQESLKNIHELLSQARIRPYFRDGKADGLAISNIKPGSFFAKLGLKNGDIVQGIDGRDIRSPDDVLEVYERLRSGSQVALQIIRDGEQRIITYGNPRR